jgi:hypothetical protein
VPATLPPSQFRMVLKTFSAAFPHVQLWYFLPARKRGPFNSILVGSNEPVSLNFQDIERRFEDGPEAYASLAPYGITSAEALLPHFVAGDEVLREAIRSEPENSLDHPRYEFFYPWDYARNRQQQVIANHEFLTGLKRKAHNGFISGVAVDTETGIRLRQTLAAEFRYLEAFGKFLSGIPLSEQYRIFDDALAVAPWNDSLRARIYAQYAYAASAGTGAAERARLMRKADALYETGAR